MAGDAESHLRILFLALRLRGNAATIEKERIHGAFSKNGSWKRGLDDLTHLPQEMYG
jgi:hypothetical protein